MFLVVHEVEEANLQELNLLRGMATACCSLRKKIRIVGSASSSGCVDVI